MKKFLSIVLTFAMILSTMSVVAFAQDGIEIGNADFVTNGGVVFDGVSYYDTLTEALAGIHGTEDAVLYCKEGADLGAMTHGHVCKNLTVYGNGAYLSGGEQDFEVDMYECPGITTPGSSLTDDVTLVVYNLGGAGAWGTRHSDYAVNYIFENCENMGKIYLTGEKGENNIALSDCTFTSNDVSTCKVYSNSAGTIILENVDFSNIDQPVALNNKSTGLQTVILDGCEFTNCGAPTADWTVPVSVKSSKQGGTSKLTVNNCSFTGTVTNSIGQDADILLDYGVGETTATILNTSAKLGMETEQNVASYAETAVEDAIIVNNNSAETKTPVAEVDGAYFAALPEALKALTDGSVLNILSDVTISEKWDGRYNGARISASDIVINGNDNTLKFTGEVNDGANYNCVFRFLGNSATINDLTIDMTEVPTSWVRAISSGECSLTVNNCNFYGNGSASARGIIFGEGGSNLDDVEISVTNCDFDSWGNSSICDNDNGGDVKAVTVSDNNIDGGSIKIAAIKNVTFTNNVVENSRVIIRSYTNSDILSVVATGNALDLAYDHQISAGATIEAQEGFALPVADINGVKYLTLASAIARATDGATINIYAGTYDAFTVPADKNNLTFVGETDAEGNNLVTIRTLENDVDTHTKGIYVQAETITFRNIDFTAGTSVKHWMSASIGNDNNDFGPRSNLENLTVENCNFTGSGVAYAIWTSQGNVTVINSTITNYVKGVDTETLGATQKMIIENTEISDVDYAFHTGAAAAGSEIIVSGSEIDSDKIDVGGAVEVSISDSKIENAAMTAYNSSSISVSESELYNTSVATNGTDASVALSNVFANNVNTLASAATTNANITFDTYYPTYEAFEAGQGAVEVPAVANAIAVKFVDVTPADAEGEKLYNINLVATNNEVINRLNSADLTFVLNQDNGENEYQIIASNDEVDINNVNNDANRYEFHYKGKTDVTTHSGNTITIGQVKFTGYGQFDFAVNADVDTNVAHATTIGDNIVDTYVPNGDATTVAEGELLIDNSITDLVIKVPTRKLTINVDFPNAVEANEYDYQKMLVKVSGEDIETIEYELGTDVALVDGKYTIEVVDALTHNTSYAVEVSGEGYRTARYTVTMTDAKVLNFWNNVKDVAFEVEEGKSASAKNVTFLAGDIVKDANINIYDLSAVVSYFGTIDLKTNVNADKYIKYDLNRDGKIDSKDVAYVLVSWGK